MDILCNNITLTPTCSGTCISYQTFCFVVPYFEEPASQNTNSIYYPTRQIVMSVRANFVDIYLRGMRDRSMRRSMR